jgi:ATP-dependent Lon protease
MLTAMASAFTQHKAKAKIAMTGEITLRGTVLPVGGIKEKVLAAARAGITKIIMCKENEKDVLEIKEAAIKDIKFIFVDRVEEVLQHALEKKPVPNALDLEAARANPAENKPVTGN